MRFGILTGGGDVPGLNPAIKAVVMRARAEGHEMVGLRRGWASVLNFNLYDVVGSRREWTMPLDEGTVRSIDRTGGTFLHTSRTNPSSVKPGDVPDFLKKSAIYGDGTAAKYDFTPHVLEVVQHLKLDALITIGGDDTLSYSVKLNDAGFPVVAIPKTMDNDVRGTDYCIGFGTAVTRATEFINNLRTSAGSHERIAVVELFGRYSGETSLMASYMSSADRCLISEVPFDVDRLCEFAIKDKMSNPSRYAMIVISEGATALGGEMALTGEADAFGHRKLGGIGGEVAEAIKRKTGQNIIYQNVAYLMRSGAPDALDLMVGLNYGTLAADLASSRQFGQMVAIQGGKYTTVPFTEVRGGARTVDVKELYDEQLYKPRIQNIAGKPMFLY